MDRLSGAPMPRSCFQGEIHHHDGVLLDDAHQQQNADDAHDGEFGLPVTQSASSAPSPAEGSVEMMVMGCVRLSYSTPSTM